MRKEESSLIFFKTELIPECFKKQGPKQGAAKAGMATK
jgi:hypothetical protein